MSFMGRGEIENPLFSNGGDASPQCLFHKIIFRERRSNSDEQQDAKSKIAVFCFVSFLNQNALHFDRTIRLWRI